MLTSILRNVNLDRYLAAYERVVRLFDGYRSDSDWGCFRGCAISSSL